MILFDVSDFVVLFDFACLLVCLVGGVLIGLSCSLCVYIYIYIYINVSILGFAYVRVRWEDQLKMEGSPPKNITNKTKSSKIKPNQ